VLDLVITLLLAGHLLAMNVASACPLVGVWLVGRRQDSGVALGLRMLRLSFAALVVGSMLGGFLLVFPNPSLRAALVRFPASAYWFAGLELVFSAACMIALFCMAERIRERRLLAWALALLTVTNLLYHFPPLMAVLGELAADPGWATSDVISRPALLRLRRRPEVIALWIHFVLASFGVALVAALWFNRGRDEIGNYSSQPTSRRLALWALVATAMQIPAGIWLLTTSSSDARDSMLGGDIFASVVFGGAVTAALYLLYTLAALALGEQGHAHHRAGLLVVVVTLLMTWTLRSNREIEAQRVGGATAKWPQQSRLDTDSTQRPTIARE
jgi:hypothetical protein